MNFPRCHVTRLAIVLALAGISGASGYAQGGGGGGGAGGGGGGGALRPDGTAGPITRFSSSENTRWGGRGSALSVLSDSRVQADLGLNEQQQRRVTEIVRSVRDAEAQARADRIGSAEKRREAFTQMGGKIAAMRQETTRLGEEIVAALDGPQRRTLAQACQQERTTAAQAAARVRVDPPRTPPGGGATSGNRAGAATEVRGADNPGAAVTTSSGWNAGGGGYASGGDPGTVIHAIRLPQVRASLALRPEQETTIDAVLRRFQEREEKLHQELGELRPAPPLPSTGDVVASTAQAGTETLLALLTPTQRQRLDEICLQAQGASALFRPEIGDALKLNPGQKARLAAIQQRTDKQRASLLGASAGGPGSNPAAGPRAPRPGSVEQLVALEKQADQEMLTQVLTPEQQQTLRRLQGRPFAGADRLPAFGGGGGRASGGGAQTVR